jgi:hypothetical protein
MRDIGSGISLRGRHALFLTPANLSYLTLHTLSMSPTQGRPTTEDLSRFAGKRPRDRRSGYFSLYAGVRSGWRDQAMTVPVMVAT